MPILALVSSGQTVNKSFLREWIKKQFANSPDRAKIAFDIINRYN